MTPRLLIKTRRAILFTAASLLLTCPLVVRATPPQSSVPTPGGRSIKRPGRIKKFGANVLDFLKCKPANARLKRELLEYGPQFPQRYDPSDFSFKALVNTNWPMGVYYRLEREATVVITIQVMGADPFTQKLTGGGMGVRLGGEFQSPLFPELPGAGAPPCAHLLQGHAARPVRRGARGVRPPRRGRGR